MGFKVIGPGFTVPFGPDVVLPAGLAELGLTENIKTAADELAPTGEKSHTTTSSRVLSSPGSPGAHLFSPVPFSSLSSPHPFHLTPSLTMSTEMSTHRRATANGEEPETPDTGQSGINTGTSRPSTGHRLSANVPAFVPTTTTTSSRLGGAPNPAMPRIRELTVQEAAAEARAWYDQEDHVEGAHAASAGTRLPGMQYDYGSFQTPMGPPMYPGYHGPFQPFYPVSQLNTGPYAAYAAAQARAGQGNFRPSTPVQQMQTGPRGMTPSTSAQESHAAASYRATAPQMPVNLPEGARFPINPQRAYQAVHEHTPSPFPSQHTAGIHPSAIAPGDLGPSNFAQWASSNDQRKAPAQYAAYDPAAHPSTPGPGDVSSPGHARRTYPPDVQRALAQYSASGQAVHSSTRAPGHVSSQSPVRRTYPPDVQRTLAQYAAASQAGQARRPSNSPPRNFPASYMSPTFPPVMPSAFAQLTEAEKFLYPSNITPGNVSGSYGGRAYSPNMLRDLANYPQLLSYDRFSALGLGGYPSTPYEEWAASAREKRASVQHAESGSATSTSTLAPGYIPPPAPVQQAYPTDRQRASTAHAEPCLSFHPALIPPGTSRSSNPAPQARSTGNQGANPAARRRSSKAAAASSPEATRSLNPAPQVPSTGYQGANPAIPRPSSNASNASNVAVASSPGTPRSSSSAGQAHSTGYQGANLAVPHRSSNVAAASYAEHTNVSWPAPLPYPGHEQFTRSDVETFIRKAQDEEWLRTSRHDEMLAQQHASNREIRAATSEQNTTATEQSGTIITEAAQRALEERRANRIRRERVPERQRAARGIPDPQEAADRAQFQRLVETYNYQNYSSTPVNPRLPNAHIVATDPATQELVTVFETVLGNMALYRRGYAAFPGSLHTQTERSSTGQSSSGRQSSRSDRITDSIPNWNDPAIRDNPEISRDFLNNSTFVSFMGPIGEAGNRRVSREHSEVPSSVSNTSSSSADTSDTPMDTPSQSENTPTESGSDEGAAPQLPVSAVSTSGKENTPRPCAPTVPVSEEEKTPRPPAAVTVRTEKAKTPQHPVPVVPPPRQERTPQRPVPVVAPTSEEKVAPRPTVPAAPVLTQDTIRPPPGFETLVSKPGNTSSQLVPASRPTPRVTKDLSRDVFISPGVSISPFAHVPSSSYVLSPITYANIAAGRVRVSHPSPEPRETPAMRTFYRGQGNTSGPQESVIHALSNISEGPDDNEAMTPTPAAKRGGRPSSAKLASSAFRDLSIPQMPTLQTTDSAFNQHIAAEGVAPSQTGYPAQGTPAGGNPSQGLGGPTKRSHNAARREYKKRRAQIRREMKRAAAALQQDHESPNDEGETLPTEAQ